MKKWRWARNGAIFGILVVLIDLLLASQGLPYYRFWAAGMSANKNLIAGVFLPAYIGYFIGAIRDRWKGVAHNTSPSRLKTLNNKRPSIRQAVGRSSIAS